MLNDEWPLTVFTVTAQLATGAFWWCCVAVLAGGLAPEQVVELERLSPVVWVMVMLAFCAAAFHLGRPLRMLNAINRFGRSHFSNEVVFGSAFVGFGLIGWLLGLLDIAPAGLRYAVFALALLCSLGFLFSMTAFYMIRTVPTWNTPLTPAAYLLTALIGGSAIAATLFAAADVASGLLLYGPAAAACAGRVAAIVVTLLQGARLLKIRSSIRTASETFPHFAPLMSARFAILAVALAIWLPAMTGGLSVGIGTACAVLVLLGEMVGRGVHYGLHMTVGLR